MPKARPSLPRSGDEHNLPHELARTVAHQRQEIDRLKTALLQAAREVETALARAAFEEGETLKWQRWTMQLLQWITQREAYFSWVRESDDATIQQLLSKLTK